MRKIHLLLITIVLSNIVTAQTMADTILLKKHLEAMVSTSAPRNHANPVALNEVADYIRSVLELYADTVYEQEFFVKDIRYRNIIAAFDTVHHERIIVGAHYYVCGNQAGADDNASGIAGLLELARLSKGKKFLHRIELVAYTLEESPYFATVHMGSYVHARSLYNQDIAVKGMVCLEMIGYFNDEKNSQQYPLKALKWIYGSKANYITVVQKFGSGRFARKFTRKMRANSIVRTKVFKGPKALTGIDLSDHRNYWDLGYSAVMITDTSFYRNANYHRDSDTIATLDLLRMGQVVDGVFRALPGK